MSEHGPLMRTARRFFLPAVLSAYSIVVAAVPMGGGESSQEEGRRPRSRDCSSIDLVNHGHSVFGKNLDNTYSTGGLILINTRGVERYGRGVSTTGQRAHWVSRYASVNFSFVHIGHVWTGMNEKGLVISMMGIPEAAGPPPDHRPPLEDGQWVQYMLDTCATVDEVLTASRDFRIITIDHYHVADRSGDSAVFEFIDGDEIVYAGDDLPVSVLTNSTYADSIHDWRRLGQGWFPPPNGSIERFRIAAERVLGFESTDVDSAVEYAFDTLFAIRSEAIYPYPNTTQWSIVFDTQNLRAYFRTYDHPGIKHFDIYDLDPTCTSPVRMLDIQTPGTGDVSELFEDLTFEAAYDHYWQFIESFLGRTPDPNDVGSVISYFMDIHCVGTGIAPYAPSGRRTP